MKKKPRPLFRHDDRDPERRGRDQVNQAAVRAIREALYKLPLGKISNIQIWHEDGCPMPEGGQCTCEKVETRLVTPIDETSG